MGEEWDNRDWDRDWELGKGYMEVAR